jgi:Zn-dependent protease
MLHTMQVREHIALWREIQDFILADAVLTLSFALVFIGGLSNAAGDSGALLALIPIAFVAVTCSFVLHELMHKFTAQHYGAVAAFRTSQMGLAITLVTGFLGFLIGIPGATVIYTNNFTKKENGIVSLAGPLTNFAVFGVFLLIGYILFPNFVHDVGSLFTSNENLPYLQLMLSVTLYIAIILAFFNMLPIFPLDGSKVLSWSPPIFFGVIAALFVIIILVLGSFFIFDLVVMLIIAGLFNFFYRGVGLGL